MSSSTKNKGGSPEHKLTSPTFKAMVLAEIGKYDRRGYSQHQIVAAIAPLVKLSQPSVCVLLKEMRLQYKTQLLADRADKVNEMLAAYRDIRSEAWDAYEKSKQDSERFVRESGKAFDPTEEMPKNSKNATGRKGESAESSLVLLKQIVTTEGRLPANVYLQTVLDTLKAERELLGLDAPKDINLRAEVATGPSVWDVLAQVGATPALEIVASNDPVERMIEDAGKPLEESDDSSQV